MSGKSQSTIQSFDTDIIGMIVAAMKTKAAEEPEEVLVDDQS